MNDIMATVLEGIKDRGLAEARGHHIESLLKEIDALKAENEAQRRDLAMHSHSLGALYAIREALGFNKLYPLSHLDGDARQMRAALLACAPFAHAVIAEERKDAVGNSDLDNEQPVSFHIRTTLGAVREASRALFVANIHAPR